MIKTAGTCLSPEYALVLGNLKQSEYAPEDIFWGMKGTLFGSAALFTFVFSSRKHCRVVAVRENSINFLGKHGIGWGPCIKTRQAGVLSLLEPWHL